MNKQKQIRDVPSIPSEALDDWGPVPVPLGEPISQVRGLVLSENADGSSAGVWECTPGKWVRQIMDAEVSTFLKGKAIFTPEGGEPIHISAGDVVYFPANSKGNWEIIETTRKTYLCYKSDA